MQVTTELPGGPRMPRPAGGRLRGACLAGAGALLLIAFAADASRFGRSGFSGNPQTNGGSVCSVCHAAGDAQAPQVSLFGPSVVDAGTTVTFSVTITGGPAVTAGVGISVSDGLGTLAPVDASLALLDGELVHPQPQPFGGGQRVFEFQWTAPAFDTEAVVYAAGNSTDGNLDLAGDGVAATSLTVAVVNGFEDPPPPPPPPDPAPIALEEVASGLADPVALANAGDARLFVVEQRGRIRLIDGAGMLRPTPFLDIVDRVKLGGSEEGLLGLAFHPDFADNGYLYVNYIFDPGPSSDRTRVSRFTVSAGDPDLADPQSELVLMEFVQPFDNHNGGDLHFGPDGYLYIASGDGGSGGDPQNNAQNPGNLLGKLLRIDVDTPPGPGAGPDCAVNGGSAYSIPPSNAFNDGAGGAGCDEIYLLGVRNPWRFSFDRIFGDLWIGDVGQSRIEEIDFVAAGTAGGLNLGWRCYEGREPYNLADCDDPASYLDPVFDYDHAGGDCSVTGGFVYRGQDYPALRGQYLFSDFCNPAIRALSGPVDALVESVVLPPGDAVISAFGEDWRGELYVADLAGGRVLRIVASGQDPDGDVDGDGDVDRIDLYLIRRAVGQPALGPQDPRDLDGDGFITRRDVFLAAQNCTRPQCAVG